MYYVEVIHDDNRFLSFWFTRIGEGDDRTETLQKKRGFSSPWCPETERSRVVERAQRTGLGSLDREVSEEVCDVALPRSELSVKDLLRSIIYCVQ